MDSDDYLSLSGIQHFAFCKRQWALIHLEQQWEENWRTSGGHLFHSNADKPDFNQNRKNVIITRAVPVISNRLRVSGIADVVEYHQTSDGIRLPGKDGYYSVVPIEYKFGQKKENDCDDVQLCAQALCLEEMLNTSIPFGYLFYGKTRRRYQVIFDSSLRNRVEDLISEMYDYLSSSVTPPASYKNHCQNCSLISLCLPQVSERKKPVGEYLAKFIRR